MKREAEVIHAPRLNKFLLRLCKGKYAYVEYEVEGSVLYVTGAYTPEEFRGRGIASRIMAEVVKYAEKEGLKVVPICSFARYFFERHPEYRHVLA